jgi:ribonuclease D
MASELPASIAELERIRDLPPKLIAGSGPALLAAIEGAPPLPATAPAEPPDRSLVKRLQEAVKERATALGVQPELLATRRDIALAASGQLSEPLATGWRGTVLADIFAGFISDRAN